MEILAGVGFGLATAIGWGTADFLAASASRSAGPWRTSFWSQLSSFLLFLVYGFAAGELNDWHVEWLPWLAVMGAFQTVAVFSLYRGLAIGLVSLVSPIASGWMVVTVVLSVIFWQEQPGTTRILGIVLTTIGVALASTDLAGIGERAGTRLARGTREGLTAMLAWGILLAMMVPASQQTGWFFPVLMVRAFGIATLGLAAAATGKPLTMRWSWRLALLVALVGLLDGGAFFTYSLGVRLSQATVVAPISATLAVVSIALARLFFAERMLKHQMAGAAGVVAGLVMISL